MGDEAGAASLSTVPSRRVRGVVAAGPCGLASTTGDAGVALKGWAFGSVVMGGFLFLSSMVLPNILTEFETK